GRAEGVEGLRRSAPFDAVGDVLGERGAVLEAVAGAAAEEPPPVALGVPVEEEMRVCGQVVLADARSDDGRVRERREPAREVVACELPALRVRQTGELVRIDLGARPLPGALEAEAADLTEPVIRARVVAEPRPARPASVDTGEEDVAPRDPLLDEAGEELRQPGAAGPHDDVGPRRVGGRGAAELEPQVTCERARGEA